MLLSVTASSAWSSSWPAVTVTAWAAAQLPVVKLSGVGLTLTSESDAPDTDTVTSPEGSDASFTV